MHKAEIARRYALNVTDVRRKLLDSPATPPPVVTFILPLFNQGEFLHQAAASCELSWCGPKEILVVNDGSTDKRTFIYLEELAADFPSCRVIHQENKLLPGARNTGIKEATGEFIQFLDADDMLLPDKVTFQVLQLRAQTECGASVSGWFYFSDDMERFSSPRNCPEAPELRLKDFLFSWERGLTIPIHAPLFRRAALRGTTFEEGLHAKEDWVFWCDLAASGCRLCSSSYPGAVYRQHKRSMTHSQAEKNAQSWGRASAVLDSRYGSDFPAFRASAEEWYERWYVPLLAETDNL